MRRRVICLLHKSDNSKDMKAKGSPLVAGPKTCPALRGAIINRRADHAKRHREVV